MSPKPDSNTVWPQRYHFSEYILLRVPQPRPAKPHHPFLACSCWRRDTHGTIMAAAATDKRQFANKIITFITQELSFSSFLGKAACMDDWETTDRGVIM